MGYRDKYFSSNPSDHGWYTCVSCGRSFRKGDIDIDHIIPQSRGGNDDLENLQCMCKHCNRSKRDDMKYTEEDLIANMTGVRLGTREELDLIDDAADELESRRKKRRLW